TETPVKSPDKDGCNREVCGISGPCDWCRAQKAAREEDGAPKSPKNGRTKAGKSPRKPRVTTAAHGKGSEARHDDGGDDPQDAATHRDELPNIVIGVDEGRVNAEALAALTKDTRLYCRGDFLVEVRRDARRSKAVIRPPNAPRIVQVPKPVLCEMMAD